MNNLKKISDLFDVTYGNGLELYKLEVATFNDSEAINFVSRISKNNGLDNLITLCQSCHKKQHPQNKYFIKKEEVEPLPKGYPPRIEDYVPPKWHLWVYGGYRRPSFE